MVIRQAEQCPARGPERQRSGTGLGKQAEKDGSVETASDGIV
jgi:hypothetical protein